MEQAARAAGIADTPDPDLAPTRDVELGQPFTSSGANASRASLPLSHRKSMSISGRKGRAESTRSRANSNLEILGLGGDTREAEASLPVGAAVTTGDDEEGVTTEDAEIPWGPEHPCFPHPNPHVPVTSTLYTNTRIIRVKRDWMIAGDLTPAFTLIYPEILDYFACFSEESFRELIQGVNRMLEGAFSPWSKSAWLDTILGIATGWLWDDFGLSKAKYSIAQIEDFLETWNQQQGAVHGVRIIPLRRTGYLSLDIQIPDPHIVDADEFDTEIDTQIESLTADGEANTSENRKRDHSFGRASFGSRSGSAKGTNRSRSASGSRRDVVKGDDTQPTVPPIPTEHLQTIKAVGTTPTGFGKGDEGNNNG